MNLITPAAWCAALFAAATLFSHTVALRLLLLFSGIGLLAAEVLRNRLRRDRPIATSIVFAPPLLVPFVLWAAWAILSLAWSLDPELTGKELRNEIGYAAGAFWLCFVAAQAPSAPRVAAGALLAGALAVSLVALAEPLVARLHELQLHGGPGAFSSTLLILFPCALAGAWLAWKRKWPRAWVALPLLLLPLFVAAGYKTQNRILWLALAAEIVLAAFLLAGRAALARRQKAAIGLLAVVIVAAGVAITLKVHGERFGAAAIAKDPRPQIWQYVLGRIEERPLTGIGFGRGLLRHELREEGKSAQIWHSHNLFLDAALQLGWPGLALLLVLFGWTAGLAWRLARSANDTAFACGLALLPLVAGTMLRNMTDVLWVRQSALLYWAAVGLLLAWGLRAAPEQPAR